MQSSQSVKGMRNGKTCHNKRKRRILIYIFLGSTGNLYDIARGERNRWWRSSYLFWCPPERIMDHVLLIAQFLNMSLYMLGSASNYLEGYGVYEITRICKKNKLARIVNFIILKKLVAYEAIKIIMLLVLMRATGTGRVAVEAKSLIYSVLLSILIDYLFITIQMIIEVILDSRIGAMTISIVYVALLMIPSVAGMRRASPLCFLPLIPNLPMIARVDTQSIWYITLPFVIVLTIISWIIFIKVIKRKDLI